MLVEQLNTMKPYTLVFCGIFSLIFPDFIRAQESSVTNSYQLFCDNSEHGNKQNSIRVELTKGNVSGNMEKDSFLGLTMYIEHHSRPVITDVKDLYNHDKDEIRQMSADRMKASPNSRLYFSGDDGIGYELTKRLDVSTSNCGIKLSLSF